MLQTSIATLASPSSSPRLCCRNTVAARYRHRTHAHQSSLRLLAIAIVSAATGLSTGVIPLSAQSATTSRLAAIDDSVRSVVGVGAPGVAVGVVRDGQLVHTFYVGEADLSHRVPVGPSSRFNIASNAKQFTAAVALSLVQEGRLKLDTPLRTLVPDALPLIGDAVTVRHLLTHTSGIRDVYDLWSLSGVTWWRSFVSNGDARSMLRAQRGLNFSPGSDYLYSNSNYILLTEVVRAVTDSSFADVSAERFRKWGMPATEFLTNASQVITNRTRPYGKDREWQEYPSVAAVHGDGGLYTTLPDQLAWEVRLQRASGSGATASLEQLSQAPVAGSALSSYGYGVELGTVGGLPLVFHDGSTGAYNATFLRFPSRRISVVVMSNNGMLGVRALAMRYADVMLAGAVSIGSSYPGGPSRIQPVQDPTPWLGDYRASTGALITIARADSGLVRRIPGSPDVRLLPDTGNMYRYQTNASLKMVFDRDSAGAPRFVIYIPTQVPNVGRRLPPPPAPVPTAAWIGRYVNDETGAEITILAVDRQQVSVTFGGRAVTGTLVRTDMFVASGYEWQRVSSSSGAVDSLLLRGERVRRVVFKRVPCVKQPAPKLVGVGTFPVRAFATVPTP
jgi:CubicO group peptidase (beta-lactamase class C family)